MKKFNKLFDIFLYESVFISLFSGILYLMEDSYFSIVFILSIISACVAIILGIIGITFKLFVKDPKLEDF